VQRGSARGTAGSARDELFHGEAGARRPPASVAWVMHLSSGGTTDSDKRGRTGRGLRQSGGHTSGSRASDWHPQHPPQEMARYPIFCENITATEYLRDHNRHMPESEEEVVAMDLKPDSSLANWPPVLPPLASTLRRHSCP
jgi:hypothetical protein